ncbi:MAG TPA: ABC transporter permease, partial [Thermomicrobiales bacterium]|nr:ABC transporter permease [Thermomicrobiales bacterium]
DLCRDRPEGARPMSSQAMTRTETATLEEMGRMPPARSERSRIWRRFVRYKPGLVGLTVIGLLVILAVFAPWIAPHSPTETETSLRGAAPSAEYLLGNDDIGRDILSRIIYGARVALIVGLGATAIAVTIGVTIGATAGYFGGRVDFILSRFVDTLMAFPLLALLLTLSSVFGPSLRNVVIVIGLTVWASYARLVRAEVLSLRERDFVLAARAIGAGDRRIIFRHIVPNALGPVIVIASLAIGGVIILESALSFLGLGVSRPTASWGTMLSDGREFIRNYPHIAIAPGIAITITVLSFNLVGDGLRDALDPRQKE